MAAAALTLLGAWSIVASAPPRRPRLASPGVLASVPLAPNVDIEEIPLAAGPVDGVDPGETASLSGEEQPPEEAASAEDEPAASTPGEEQAAPTPSPRPRPRRDYPLPTGRFAAAGPLSGQVVRWQQIVEVELATLRRVRPLDPNITPHLVLAIIAAESNGDPLAISRADAVGLMQVLPSTFADLQGDADPFDPSLNVRAGITYLDMALRGHQGDLEWALAGYNAGIAGSLQARAGAAALFDETIDYVTYVMHLLSRPVTIRVAASTATPTATASPMPMLAPVAEVMPVEDGGLGPDEPNRLPPADEPSAGALSPASDVPTPRSPAQPVRPDGISDAAERSVPFGPTATVLPASAPPSAASSGTTVVVLPGVTSTTVPASAPPVASATPTLTSASATAAATASATASTTPDSRSTTPATTALTPSVVSSPSPARPPGTATVTVAPATGSPAVPVQAATFNATDGRLAPTTPGPGPPSPTASGTSAASVGLASTTRP